MTYGAPAAPGDLTQPQGTTPVFVDASGRRWRRVRWLGVVLAGLLGAYLVLLAAALVGPPALSRITVPGLGPVLPGPGAASLGDGRGGSATPREALVRPSPDATASGARPTPGPTPPVGTSATTGPATSGPVPAPAEPPAPEPAPAPAPAAPAAPAPSRPAPAATPPAEQPTARPTPSREPAPASTGGRPSEQPSPAAGRPSEQPGQGDRNAGTTGTSSTDRPTP